MKCYMKKCSHEGVKDLTVFGKRLGELCLSHYKRVQDAHDQPLTILTMVIEHLDEVPPVHESGTVMRSRNSADKCLIVLKTIPWERHGTWETGYKVYRCDLDEVMELRADTLNRGWKVDNG